MKKVLLTIAAILTLGLGNVLAEENHTNSVRTIKSPRFARPLVEKWIEEYAKTEPGVTFQIAKGQGESDLSVAIADQQEKTQDLFSHWIYIGETAVLPITARSSEAARLLEGKHLNAKKLKQLFFLNDDFEEDVKRNKAFEAITIYSGSNATSVAGSFAHNFGEESTITIYSGSNATSVAGSFAHNFGEESTNFRGKRIAGDDLFLNTAIAKDPLGVSFNTLSNIFDLQSRRLKSDLSLVGLDLKKDVAVSFSDKGSLDEVLTILETEKPAEVTVGKVAITYNGTDEAVSRFLQWVLENGTKYNHQYGLLNLNQKELSAQVSYVH